MTNKESKTRKNILKLSWIPYILILFEMLYMATPFAIFFYSIYELPLKFLNSYSATSWMLSTVFPHFVETSSSFINSLLIVGWLITAFGLLVFIIAFIQIYYAKFAKKGAVTAGLYRIIRHPQYTAWTLFGLGMSIIWSRIIVWLMFVTMTLIYYLLAKAEEKECADKFPDAYIPYLHKTGMFFPKLPFLNKIAFPKININKSILITAMYLTAMVVSVFLGFTLKNYTISKMATSYGSNYTTVSLTYIEPETVKSATEIVLGNNKVKTELKKHFTETDKMILYLLPQNWVVAELGMTRTHGSTNIKPSDNPHTSPASHGNPADTEPMKKRVIISLAKLSTDCRSERILYNLKQQIPKFYVDVDLQSNTVTNIITSLPKGIYGDIPVPVY